MPQPFPPSRYLIVHPALTRQWERASLEETGRANP